uniref:[histone H3]-trimethyl-L-lysine(9) demethylase n=1 Tax=Geotrypetes seraphini TaxID=260995 RepID=A0A6P8NUJ1_GEOSA|nr:lysine-specific demethylase 4C [Geotrypetes seraphini]XP_033774615.1 lysine-specific demethylase 4C [Geotrypetes seraphini]
MAAEYSNSPLNPNCKILTFRPTLEEFRDFNKYLMHMEMKGAHRAGLAKVIPPKGWKPKRHYDDIDDLVIPAPIQQMVTGQSGLFTQYNIQKKPMTVQEFRRLANSDKYCTPRYLDYEDLERKYWKNLTFVAPIYGADINGSLYDKDVDEWNISRLNTILDVVEEVCGISIEGVNTPYLYFGMWKTTFAWHTEDMDLYSINYLHFGEPKSWYAIPPEHGRRLERLAQGFFPSSSQGCDAFLRHKMTLISPSILKKYGIPFDKVTQEAGEFMITFPYGYHAGFNHGFNCAESTNFASTRWIDYGKVAKLCSCSNDMVKISMDIFVKKFQPKRYRLWKQGKDICNIDHIKPASEVTPEVKAWLRRRKSRLSSKGLQHARSKCKKLKTPEDERTSAIVELAAPEAATEDGLKVNEKPKEVKLENTEVPFEEESSMKEVQLDDNLLDSIHLSGTNSTESIFSSASTVQEIKIETEFKIESHIASSRLEESSVCMTASANFEKTENDLKCERETEESVSCQKPYAHPSLKAENLDKLETSSISTDDGASDLDNTDSILESGEIRSIINNEKNGLETSTFSSQKTVNREKKIITKSWRHPLNKPPPRSPMMLVKQQTISDEEFPEIPLIEVEVGETEPWAKPLVHLWQQRKRNFHAEREYNASVAQLDPYCAICTLVLPYYRMANYDEEIKSSWESKVLGIPPEDRKSKPLIPEMCFLYNKVNTKHSPLNTLVEDGRSILISCAKCCVRVHASCYGVPYPEIHNGWLCSRCRIGAWTAECCLCTLRGGALKETTDQRWAHVMCAIAVPEVQFVNVMERTPISIRKIPLERLKLKCIFCRQRFENTSGACVQCSFGRCPTSFHVTCAHAAGVLMEPSDWPHVIYITCFRHKSNHVRTNLSGKAISIGQTVISKHKNARYYSCRVTKVTAQTFYKIVFDDGSFSSDTFPEDIVNRDCLKLGPPAVGEVVQVKWPDGILYGAKYLGTNVVQIYQVEFEDESQLTVKREEIYTQDEELPKRVKARLSTASAMRYEETFYGEELIQGEKKRQRLLNGKLKNEYVNESGYRMFFMSSFQKKYQNGL